MVDKSYSQCKSVALDETRNSRIDHVSSCKRLGLCGSDSIGWNDDPPLRHIVRKLVVVVESSTLAIASDVVTQVIHNANYDDCSTQANRCNRDATSVYKRPAMMVV